LADYQNKLEEDIKLASNGKHRLPDPSQIPDTLTTAVILEILFEKEKCSLKKIFDVVSEYVNAGLTINPQDPSFGMKLAPAMIKEVPASKYAEFGLENKDFHPLAYISLAEETYMKTNKDMIIESIKSMEFSYKNIMQSLTSPGIKVDDLPLILSNIEKFGQTQLDEFNARINPVQAKAPVETPTETPVETPVVEENTESNPANNESTFEPVGETQEEEPLNVEEETNEETQAAETEAPVEEAQVETNEETPVVENTEEPVAPASEGDLNIEEEPAAQED